ncbi:MAG: S4 domain-containing protein, partial [Candidatus Binatia bacterium]
MIRTTPSAVRVPPLEAAARLDVFLAASGLASSRSQAKVMVDAGRVRVDGAPRKAGFLLHGGEKLDIEDLPERPTG